MNNPVPATLNGIVVANAGCNGEAAQALGTLSRFRSKVNYYRPDLILFDGRDQRPETSVSAGSKAYARSPDAQRQGIPVIVSTIPPQIGSQLTHGGSPTRVEPFNNLLRPAVVGAGGSVVDGYAALWFNPGLFISPYDGLHLTGAGYQELARVWFGEDRPRLRAAHDGLATDR